MGESSHSSVVKTFIGAIRVNNREVFDSIYNKYSKKVCGGYVDKRHSCIQDIINPSFMQKEIGKNDTDLLDWPLIECVKCYIKRPQENNLNMLRKIAFTPGINPNEHNRIRKNKLLDIDNKNKEIGNALWIAVKYAREDIVAILLNSENIKIYKSAFFHVLHTNQYQITVMNILDWCLKDVRQYVIKELNKHLFYLNSSIDITSEIYQEKMEIIKTMINLKFKNEVQELSHNIDSREVLTTRGGRMTKRRKGKGKGKGNDVSRRNKRK